MDRGLARPMHQIKGPPIMGNCITSQSKQFIEFHSALFNRGLLLSGDLPRGHTAEFHADDPRVSPTQQGAGTCCKRLLGALSSWRRRLPPSCHHRLQAHTCGPQGGMPRFITRMAPRCCRIAA